MTYSHVLYCVCVLHTVIQMHMIDKTVRKSTCSLLCVCATVIMIDKNVLPCLPAPGRAVNHISLVEAERLKTQCMSTRSHVHGKLDCTYAIENAHIQLYMSAPTCCPGCCFVLALLYTSFLTHAYTCLELAVFGS